MPKNECASEYVVTKQVADYLRFKNVPFIHVPNEAKRSPQTASMLKAMGMSAGFPDMFIFRQCRGFGGMAIELKREKNGKVSDAQYEWLRKLTNEGYYAVICRGTESALAEIDDYLEGDKR